MVPFLLYENNKEKLLSVWSIFEFCEPTHPQVCKKDKSHQDFFMLCNGYFHETQNDLSKMFWGRKVRKKNR